MPVKYKALVLSCIDTRFQPIVFEYLKKRKLDGRYSCFTIAGAAINEEKIHVESFNKIKKLLKKKHPNLSIELNLISLDKSIKKFE